VPPTGSPAKGTGVFIVDTAANTVSYQITVEGLLGVEPAAHIHGFAAPGSNAGVKITTVPGATKTGVWPYPESDEAGILAGRAYVNVHTTMFPAGELRGQMHLCSLFDPNFTNYCTAGTSTSGCRPTLSAAGLPSASCPSGFVLTATGGEGNKDGLFFYGTNGQQAVSWGNGTSF
jgi:hypothetical protein